MQDSGILGEWQGRDSIDDAQSQNVFKIDLLDLTFYRIPYSVNDPVGPVSV